MTKTANNVLDIGLLGAGRMGRQIAHEIAADARYRLAGVWVRAGSARRDFTAGGDVRVDTDIGAVAGTAAVLVDFSLASATREVLAAAVAARKPLVCGVSGLDPGTQRALCDASAVIPVFYDRNMSIGVAVMRRLVRDAGRLLGPEYGAEIDELHHAAKRDAPSGTALMLGETLAASRGEDFGAAMRYEPDTTRGRPAPGEIRFYVTREGHHPGRHTLTLANDAERLSITHEVSDRRVFAQGALRAAAWLAGRDPGLYGMAELLDEQSGA